MSAKARMTYRWDNGDEFEAVVMCDSSYPDAVAEAKAQTLAMFREGMGLLVPEPETVEGE